MINGWSSTSTRRIRRAVASGIAGGTYQQSSTIRKRVGYDVTPPVVNEWRRTNGRRAMDNADPRIVANPRVDAVGEYSPHSRVDGIIALGRLVIIPYGLLAFGRDPSPAGLLWGTGFALLAGYCLYVVGVCGYAWLGRAPTRWRRVADQVLDGT